MIAMVRVYVVTYRRPHLLERALRSLLAQSCTAWVAEVLNDDPADARVAELIARLGDRASSSRNRRSTAVAREISITPSAPSLNPLPQSSRTTIGGNLPSSPHAGCARAMARNRAGLWQRADLAGAA